MPVSRSLFGQADACSSSKHQRKETPGTQRLQLILGHITLHGRSSLSWPFRFTRPVLESGDSATYKELPSRGLAYGQEPLAAPQPPPRLGGGTP